MIPLIGWLGAFCFAVCSLPQAWKCYREKSAEGISLWFVGLWAAGEILSTVYVISHEDMTAQAVAPLVLNYTINLLGINVILWYKLKP